jgi:hypothetical protein
MVKVVDGDKPYVGFALMVNKPGLHPVASLGKRDFRLLGIEP